MEIKFSNIVPAPIPEKDIKLSEIWSRDIVFTSSHKYLIYAESGKGKTTFINIIFGKRKDYTGYASINNIDVKDINDNDFSEIRRNKLSIVPQGLNLFPDLTLLENIKIKNKISNYKTDNEIQEMIDLLELSGMENRMAGKLSFGQRQRTAIIRSLCQDFEFILLDEAFSHLDNRNTDIAWKLIVSEAEKRNAGVICTSLTSEIDNNLIKLMV